MHAKVERAHVGLSRRKNPNKAAAAAQLAARSAAAAGASPAIAAEAAKAAALATDLDAEDLPKADAAEVKAIKVDEPDAPAEISDKADDKADDKAANGSEQADTGVPPAPAVADVVAAGTDNNADKSDKTDAKEATP